MAVLNSTQRSSLEKAVIKARTLSVRGANNSLKAFAVDNKEPYSHMSAEERELRNHLRSKARLMGDHTTTDGGHTIDKLAYELAYEYWHQMLFAKFLEANSLLMHPEHGISVSLEECEELAQEEGFDNKWQAAAHYASKMLPAIFRQDDPLMQLKYSTNDRLALEELIEGISEDVFKADDSLGWVYQYWQTKEKERINEEGNKIDGNSISAVTQLFTEPYMVHFLIDNTLGAWWTARNPVVTSPYEFKYLRTLDDGTPAAGSFDGWPETLSEITMLDPCMGSGHFVIDVFMAMAKLRMHDENLSKAEACDAVIRENIHGLEIDARCTQIAAFNLALTAWKFCGEYRILPEMNLACSGIAPTGKKEDWVKLAYTETDPEKKERLKGGLARMYDLFQQAPEIGSLIDPTTIEKDAFTSDFEELQPFLEAALNKESGDKVNARAVIAAGVAKAGALLAKRYVWQITNVPFLGRGLQSDLLMRFADEYYEQSKGDLATIFIDRIYKGLIEKGSLSLISPQNWLYPKSYQSMRKLILKDKKIDLIIKVGTKAFDNISGEVVNIGFFVISKYTPVLNHSFSTIDVSEGRNADQKKNLLIKNEVNQFIQVKQLSNLQNRIVFSKQSNEAKLGSYGKGYEGSSTGDKDRFLQFFLEQNLGKTKNWTFFQKSPNKDRDESFSGCSDIIYWEEGNGVLESSDAARIQGLDAFGKTGVLVGRTGDITTGLYYGDFFDKSCVAFIPKNKYCIATTAFLLDDNIGSVIRKYDARLSVATSVITDIPVDIEYWQKIADEKYPNGPPKPYSDDPTQWLFHGHPLYSESPLQVAIARLIGYEWPAENDPEMELSEEAKEKIKTIKELELPFDQDGIVCIPAVNGEASASDRIRENIISIWGDDYDGSTLSNLIEQEGSNKRDLETYLREDYFAQHCKLFKNRPFVWHIWDGRKDGFAALVNYHKLDKATLEKLIFTYLGDWINQCDLKMQNNVSGADGLLFAAKALKEKLELILKGEPPYDVFIRWKSLAEQPIGWEPDINDGVRMNIYPFIQAGVLRKKFNVKWDKDRGKNPSGSHWGPERWNRYEDLDDEWKLKDENKNSIPHLTNEVKRKARK